MLKVSDLLAQGNWQDAPVSDQDREMLRYVDKLTLRPGEMVEGDVIALREAGFTDRAIADVAMNAALFAFFNRIVDGLGGTLDDGMEDDARELGLGHPDGAFHKET
jgi:uncharacterized peroxidase-related enzyme